MDDVLSDVEERRLAIADASNAVASSASPRLLAGIRVRSVPWPTGDIVVTTVNLLVTAMEQDWHNERTIPWWAAVGDDLEAALCVVIRDLPREDASYLLGAAVQAHILGGADMAPDAILRLAERAACWRAGAGAFPPLDFPTR